MLIINSSFLLKNYSMSALNLRGVITIFIFRVCDLYSLYFVANSLVNKDSYNTALSWNSFKKVNFSNILFNLCGVLWKRLIFRGKGFRVKIFRLDKKITLNFGHSHWAKLFFGETWDYFKLHRQNYLLFTLNKKNLINYRREK